MLAAIEDSEATILNNADKSLYASKENGQNRVTHCIDVNREVI